MTKRNKKADSNEGEKKDVWQSHELDRPLKGGQVVAGHREPCRSGNDAGEQDCCCDEPDPDEAVQNERHLSAVAFYAGPTVNPRG